MIACTLEVVIERCSTILNINSKLIEIDVIFSKNTTGISPFYIADSSSGISEQEKISNIIADF